MFYYGRELYYHGFYTEADAIEEEFTRRTDGWYVNKIEARKIQATCRAANGNTIGAKNALFSSFLYGAPRAGVLCALGRLYKDENDFSSAYSGIMRRITPTIIARKAILKFPPNAPLPPFLLEMVCCAYFAGDEALSRKCHKECMRLFSDHPSVLYNQKFFASHPAAHGGKNTDETN